MSKTTSGSPDTAFRTKTVGRRIDESRVPLEESRQLLRTAAAVRPVTVLVPRGIYRFSSFEEADRWMRETIALTLARRRSRTSSESAAR